jgi:hypothetical protein
LNAIVSIDMRPKFCTIYRRMKLKSPAYLIWSLIFLNGAYLLAFADQTLVYSLNIVVAHLAAALAAPLIRGAQQSNRGIEIRWALTSSLHCGFQ